MTFPKYRLTLILVAVFLTACGVSLEQKKNTLGADDSSSISPSPLPQPTPPPEGPEPPHELPVLTQKLALEKKGTLAGKAYVAKVLADAFNTSTVAYQFTSTAANGVVYNRYETDAIDKYIRFNPSIFGGSCNPWSSYTSRDCGGSVVDGALTSLQVEGSVLRQLNKSKTCETLLDVGADKGLKSVAEKVGGLSAGNFVEINDSILTNLHALFFRTRAITPEELEIYRNTNLTIKNDTSPLSLTARWRAIVLLMCEDPNWEIF